MVARVPRSALAPCSALGSRLSLCCVSLCFRLCVSLCVCLGLTTTAVRDASAGWSPQFHLPGWPDGGIVALAVYRGDLVAAGNFRFADGQRVNRIARWDGTRWQPLGDGFDGLVKALQVSGDTLYAAGDFHASGNIVAQSVAAWDGRSWKPLDAGIEGRVNCLALWNGGLVAGGYFQHLRDERADNLCRWNGTAWQPLLPDTADDPRAYEITSMAGVGDEFLAVRMYACQDRPPCPDCVPCGVQVRAYASDGSGWHYTENAWGGWFYAYSLVAFEGGLFGAGDFNLSSGGFSQGVASYDGAFWSLVGDLFPGPRSPGRVFVLDGKLTVFVPGAIRQWDGTAWNDILPLPRGEVDDCVSYNGEAVVGGWFAFENPYFRDLARWDGSAWQPIGDQSGEGMDGSVSGLARTSAGLFAVGEFAHAGRTPAYHWARFDGAGWQSLLPGMLRGPVPLASYRDTLYAAGAPMCDGICPGLARWDGERWESAGELPVRIAVLARHEGRLIAGGEEETPSSSGWRVAAYDGGSWTMLGPLMDRRLSALVSHSDTLYACSPATWRGIPPRLTAWDGYEWHTTADSLPSDPLVACSYGGRLVTGSRKVICNPYGEDCVARDSILAWNGRRSESLGDAPDGRVTALAVFHGDLIAAGGFTRMGAIATNHLARWDGVSWSPLGGGTDRAVASLYVEGDSLWITGSFEAAGDVPSAGIALWVEPRPAIAEIGAEWADTAAVVSWTLPDAPETRGAIVRWSRRDFPTDPRDGDPLVGLGTDPEGGAGDGDFPGSPGSRAQVVQPVTPAGGMLYYTAFAYTEPGMYSKPAHAAITVPDRTPPEVALELSRRDADDLTSELEIRVDVGEPVDSSKIVLTGGGRPLSVTPNDVRGRVWSARVDLRLVSGEFLIQAAVTDDAGNTARTARAVAAANVRAEAGGTLALGDRFRLDLAPGSLKQDWIVSVIELTEPGGLPPAFLVEPADSLMAPGLLSLSCDECWSSGGSGEDLRITLGDEPLPTTIDRAGHRLGATVPRLGRFSIGSFSGPLHVLPDWLLRVIPPRPNPTRGVCELGFEIGTWQHVRVDLYDAAGRVVRRLFDRPGLPGENRFLWDGRTETGEPAPSGVYFCLVQGERDHRTVRLVKVR